MRTIAVAVLCAMSALPQTPRPRARDIGLAPGILKPGPLNAITDVAGVRVGQVTIVEGDTVRTGVTAILPHAGNLFQEKVPAAVYVGNGFGKLAGSTQVDELGVIETPVILTNTLGVWRAGETVEVGRADETVAVRGYSLHRQLVRHEEQKVRARRCGMCAAGGQRGHTQHAVADEFAASHAHFLLAPPRTVRAFCRAFGS
jgi:hypothetical protein